MSHRLVSEHTKYIFSVLETHDWRRRLWYSLNVVWYRDCRNVNCHFCSSRALGISIPVCKEKWPNSVHKSNRQRLLQELVAKQLPTYPSKEETMGNSKMLTCNDLLDSPIPCPHFFVFKPYFCTSMAKEALENSVCRIWKLAISALMLSPGNFQKPEFELIRNSK